MGTPMPIKKSDFIKRIDRLQSAMKKYDFTENRGHARNVIANGLGFPHYESLLVHLKSIFTENEPFLVPDELISKLGQIEFVFYDTRRLLPNIKPVTPPKKPKPKPEPVLKKTKPVEKKTDKKPTAAIKRDRPRSYHSKAPAPVVVYKKVLGGSEHGA